MTANNNINLRIFSPCYAISTDIKTEFLHHEENSFLKRNTNNLLTLSQYLT